MFSPFPLGQGLTATGLRSHHHVNIRQKVPESEQGWPRVRDPSPLTHDQGDSATGLRTPCLFTREMGGLPTWFRFKSVSNYQAP